MGGSRIIFAGPNKFSPRLIKISIEKHAVYSVRKDYEDVKTNNFGEFRSESICKVKISHHINCIKSYEKIVIKSINIISSGESAELFGVRFELP